MLFLSEVEHTFTVTGRGCVIVPAVPRSDCDFRLRAKDPIQLRTPDGRVIDTSIASIESIWGPVVKGRKVFLLPAGIDKIEVPQGTQIWLPSQGREAD